MEKNIKTSQRGNFKSQHKQLKMKRLMTYCLSIYKSSNTMRNVEAIPPVIIISEKLKVNEGSLGSKEAHQQLWNWNRSLRHWMSIMVTYIYIIIYTVQMVSNMECTSMRGEILKWHKFELKLKKQVTLSPLNWTLFNKKSNNNNAI